jgi:hypothetical protein
MNTASVQQTQNSRPRWPATWTQGGHGAKLRSSGVTWLDRQSGMGGEIWLIVGGATIAVLAALFWCTRFIDRM